MAKGLGEILYQFVRGSYHTKQEVDDIIHQIVGLLGTEELHTHNSIPGYTDYVEEGCITCIKNQLLADIKKRLGVEENRGKET